MRTLSVIFLLFAFACDPSPTTILEGDSSPFDHPQAVVFIGDRLVVANTGYDVREWRPGGLVVLDLKTLSVQDQIPTARDNPQRLVVDGDRLVVVETGVLDFSDFERPQVSTTGAVEIFSLTDSGDLETAVQFELDMAPVDLAIQGDRAVVSSALETAVWSLDLQNLDRGSSLDGPHPLTPAAALGLGSVKPWREGFVAVDFNSDYAHLLDGDGRPTGCGVDLGSSDAVEGAQSPWIEGDTLYVILAFAGVVRRVNLEALNTQCTAPVETVVGALGQIPNDLHIRGDAVYVVHSADNNVVVYGLADGLERRRYVLPRGANPWHAAFSDDGRYLAVTEWAGQGLSVFDLSTGARRRVGAPTAR